MNFEDIEKLVEAILLDLIRDFVEVEGRQGKMDYETIQKRDFLAEVHKFFFEIGLCHEDWSYYFDLAKSSPLSMPE